MQKWDGEIAAMVARWDADGRDLNPQFITHDIIKAHQAGLNGESEDADFFRHFTYKAVRKDTGAYIVKTYGTEEREETAQEELFPGFDYVQRRYVVIRGGTEIAVLAENMSEKEIEAKAKYLRRRGRNCIAHANELERFAVWRKSSARKQPIEAA